MRPQTHDTIWSVKKEELPFLLGEQKPHSFAEKILSCEQGHFLIGLRPPCNDLITVRPEEKAASHPKQGRQILCSEGEARAGPSDGTAKPDRPAGSP